MAYVVVPLDPQAEAYLRELAKRELRPARLQAARLVLDGLRAAGFNPEAPAELKGCADTPVKDADR